MPRQNKIVALLWSSILFSIVAMMGIAACTPPCPPQTPVNLPGFMLGESQGDIAEVPFVAELLGEGRWMRGEISWKQVEPEIFDQNLTVAYVDAHPEMIPEYIAIRNWSSSDSLLAEMKAYGLQPLMVVGQGNTNVLPLFQGEPAIPDRLGLDNYLGHLYLHTRATVRRYRGEVNFWQLENELNQAFLEAMWGWRTPSFEKAFGSAWGNWSFLTKILKTLYNAVKVEDPQALTTMNFHTDIPASINHGFFHPSWQESIRQWVSSIDFVGITALPNYYRATPLRGDTLEQKVLDASEMGCGKPVVVIEACYSSGPTIRGYSEDLQAQFIQQAYDATVLAGANGFFFFGIKTRESLNVTIDDKDLQNLAYVGDLFDQGNVFALLWFALTNLDYIKTHFVDVLWAVEPYWGLIRADGSHKPGWDVLHNIANSRG